MFNASRRTVCVCARRATAALAVLLLWLTPARAQDGDIPDSQDPPAIGARFPGARIIEYREVAFDEFTVLTGRAEGREPTATERLEGKVVNVGYEISKLLGRMLWLELQPRSGRERPRS